MTGWLMNVLRRIAGRRDGAPIESTPPPALPPLPRPPEHEPRYHALINRQQAIKSTVQHWERRTDAQIRAVTRGREREWGGGRDDGG